MALTIGPSCFGEAVLLITVLLMDCQMYFPRGQGYRGWILKNDFGTEGLMELVKRKAPEGSNELVPTRAH